MERHVAARILSGRLARGLGQSELAEQAGVHRTVVARTEAAGRVRDSSLKRIAAALGVTLTWLRRPFLNSAPYRTDRSREAQWVATGPSFVRKKGLTSVEALRDPEERARLGSLGLANAFVRVLNNDLPGGRLHALVVETYRKEQEPVTFPGQMFLLVLRGTIRLTLDDDSQILIEGDTVSYWGDVPNLYEPIDGPATVLEVFVDLSDGEIAVRERFRPVPD